jgi:hypothetical protein
MNKIVLMFFFIKKLMLNINIKSKFPKNLRVIHTPWKTNK